MKLYLYCKFEDAKSIIDVGYLRVSVPNRMNDPFELLAQTEMEVRRKDYDRDMSEGRIRKAFHRNLKNSGYEKSYSKFCKELESNPEHYFEMYRTELPRSYQEFIKGYLDHVSTKFGFLCLSQNNSSILMWSHYSNKHSGIVLGFETIKMKIEDRHLAFVDYSEQRIKIIPTLDVKHPGNDAEFEKLLRRKHLDWSYEEEVRVIAELKDANEKGDYNVDFPQEALEDVYFGWKCDKEKELIDFAKIKGYAPRFHKMEPHPVKFELLAKQMGGY